MRTHLCCVRDHGDIDVRISPDLLLWDDDLGKREDVKTDCSNVHIRPSKREGAAVKVDMLPFEALTVQCSRIAAKDLC